MGFALDMSTESSRCFKVFSRTSWTAKPSVVICATYLNNSCMSIPGQVFSLLGCIARVDFARVAVVLEGCFVCLLTESGLGRLFRIVDAYASFEFRGCVLPEMALIATIILSISLTLLPFNLSPSCTTRCVLTMYTLLHWTVAA